MNPDDDAARKLAEEWQLEYREAHTVSVDPRALALLPAPECRRLRAVPLETRGGAGIVAVAEPGDERFAAVRELAGEQTRFVVISERTLEALLASRLFGERGASRQATPSAAPAHPATRSPAQAQPPREPAWPSLEPTPPPAPPEAAPKIDPALLDAVVAALVERLPAPAPTTPAVEAAADAQAPPDAAPSGELESPDSDDVRRNLRETKEQLSVAHAEIDQNQRRIRSLESELTESRSLLAEARRRLQQAAEALDTGAAKLEESHDLL